MYHSTIVLRDLSAWGALILFPLRQETLVSRTAEVFFSSLTVQSKHGGPNKNLPLLLKLLQITAVYMALRGLSRGALN